MKRSIAAGIRIPFRAMAIAVAVSLAATVVLAVYLLAVLQPRVEDLTEITKRVRDSHAGYLDQESGLRGWLGTGDPEFLVTAEQGRRVSIAADGAIERATGVLPGDIIRLRLAQQAWTDRWAMPALDLDPMSLDRAELGERLRAGRVLFDDYRTAQSQVAGRFIELRDDALDQQRVVLLRWLTFVSLVLGATLGAALVQSRRLVRSIVDPVADVVATMERVAGGDLAARPRGDGPEELHRIAASLTTMTDVLAAHDRSARERGLELESTAARLRTILDLAREIAGSVSVRYVAEATAGATARVTDAQRVVVQMLDGGTDAALTAVFDSAAPRGVPLDGTVTELGQGPAGEAARAAKRATAIEDGHLVSALPLVVGGQVIGVLEVHHAAAEVLTPLVDDLLETLAAHTAAALEAARLHGAADELSKVDGLTRLANRRRLDDDLAAECSRSVRYGRPLGVVMIDLDHFKQLNDTFGHLHGDEVLARVAQLIRETVRSTDTVYRYGGEELLVLARESTLEDTLDLAERLRVLVEQDPVASRLRRTTASFGVAAAPWDAASPEGLLGCADRALYEAKRLGRNRVMAAQRPGDAAAGTLTLAPEASALHSAR